MCIKIDDFDDCNEQGVGAGQILKMLQFLLRSFSLSCHPVIAPAPAPELIKKSCYAPAPGSFRLL